MCALKLPVFSICTVYMQRDRILKATEVTIGFASTKWSFSWHPVTDKMESLLLEWTDGYTKQGVYFVKYGKRSTFFPYKLMVVTSIFAISA